MTYLNKKIPPIIILLGLIVKILFACCGDSVAYYEKSKRIFETLIELDVDFSKIKRHWEQYGIEYHGQTCVGGVHLNKVLENPLNFMVKRLEWCEWWLQEYEKIKPRSAKNRSMIAYLEKPAKTLLEDLDSRTEISRKIHSGDSISLMKIEKSYQEYASIYKNSNELLIDHYYTFRTFYAFKQIILIYSHMRLTEHLKTIDLTKVNKNVLEQLDSLDIYLADIEWVGDLDRFLKYIQRPLTLNNNQKYMVIISQIHTLIRDSYFKQIIDKDVLLSFICNNIYINLSSIDYSDCKKSPECVDSGICIFEKVYDNYLNLSETYKKILSKPFRNIFVIAMYDNRKYCHPYLNYFTNTIFTANGYFDYLRKNSENVSPKRVKAFYRFAKKFYKHEYGYILPFKQVFKKDIEIFEKNIKDYSRY